MYIHFAENHQNASLNIYGIAGFIFLLRNFGPISEFGCNFLVISEFISVIFIIASSIVSLESKILLIFWSC